MNAATLRRCELCAAELLTKQGFSDIYELATLDVRRLSLPISVLFESFTGYAQKAGIAREALALRRHAAAEGITLRHDGTYVILYDERTENRARLNFTLAHELGHAMLSHGGAGDPEEEREANAFAAALLAPLAVLRFLAHERGAALTEEEICHSFSLSREAAAYRLRELSEGKSLPLSHVEIDLLLCLFGRRAVETDKE